MKTKRKEFFPIIIDVETVGIDALQQIESLFQEDFRMCKSEVCINDSCTWKEVLGKNFPEGEMLASRLEEATEVIMLSLFPKTPQKHYEKFMELMTILDNFPGTHCAQTINQWEHLFCGINNRKEFFSELNG